ncbi:hypothetical protein L1987_34327 [Smallanthus sonchifolius]|uniref:Uncharacterized protein n=1 Tax=Smallanthus sonchifolius TaxID=185202 RepID=A0ACB9HTI3_9ASTR|nr:hypothetical protein L1987_34327 [Smallanthus sonchifolius]
MLARSNTSALKLRLARVPARFCNQRLHIEQSSSAAHSTTSEMVFEIIERMMYLNDPEAGRIKGFLPKLLILDRSWLDKRFHSKASHSRSKVSCR